MVHNQRMLAVAGMINIDPSKHRQSVWTCDTARCFGGWAIAMFSDEKIFEDENGFFVIEGSIHDKYIQYSNNETTYVVRDGRILSVLREQNPLWANHPYVRDGEERYALLNVHAMARDILGLTEDEAISLFGATNTLEEINEVVRGLVTGTEYKHPEDCECNGCIGYDDEYDEPCSCGCENDS